MRTGVETRGRCGYSNRVARQRYCLRPLGTGKPVDGLIHRKWNPILESFVGTDWRLGIDIQPRFGRNRHERFVVHWMLEINF